MNLAIVVPFRQFSLYAVALEIHKALRKTVNCKIYDYEEQHIPEKNVLFVGTAFQETFSYIGRFLPEKKVVFYTTIEGFPIFEPISNEKEIADDITIVANSEYTKMCLEAIGIKVDGVVPHGIDMHQTYDKKYLKWAETFLKGRPLVLCVSGNMPRKALDKFMVACKIVKWECPEACFILHSGGGYYNIPQLMSMLQINDFWFTNQFGKLPQLKLNALYKRATVYVQPSYCEGFGVPMIEAMRFLTPVVAVNAQPYNEIITDGKTGLLIPCEDVKQHLYLERVYLQYHIYDIDSMATAIIALIKNEKMRLSMRKEISRERMKFDSRRVYPRLIQFFK